MRISDWSSDGCSSDLFDKMDGEIEVDETFIGGKARFMHQKRKARLRKGWGMLDNKTAVMGLLERHGPDGHSHVRTAIVKGTRRKSLSPEVRRNVDRKSVE